jgi:hypothetical protein
MNNRRSVLININGPVVGLIQTYYNWASSVTPAHMLSSPQVMMKTNMLGEFFDAVLEEIFKEHYLSSYMDDEPESNRVLREDLGAPGELVGRWKMDFLNEVVAIIGTTLPDLRFDSLQPYDYGMSQYHNIIMHVDQETVPR